VKRRKLSDSEELLILLAIREEGIVGRYRLAEISGLSQGVIRGLLRALEEKGLIRTEPRQGCSLSPKGLSTLSKLLGKFHLKDVRKLTGDPLDIGFESVVLHIRGKAKSIRMGIEQRDAAIKAGAEGAITLVFTEHGLQFPGVRNKLAKWRPRATQALLDRYRPSIDDVLIVSFGRSWGQALRGGIAAVATLF
jgi:predicted transcriptional regulator